MVLARMTRRMGCLRPSAIRISGRTITSVPGRKGYLRGQLMRDQDTGEYLVQALGGAPGASSHLLATLAEANSLIVIDPDDTEIRTGDEVRVAFLAQRG